MAEGDVVALSGGDLDVGMWLPEGAIKGTRVGGLWWHIRFPKPNTEYEFKFAILNAAGEATRWEDCANRKIQPGSKYRCMSTWNNI